jgi:hypothetical protein
MLLMRAIVEYAENFFHQVEKFWIWPSNVGIFPPLLNESLSIFLVTADQQLTFYNTISSS